MGHNTGASGKGKKEAEMEKETVVEEEEVEESGEEAEQDGMSVHSPCKPASSALRKSYLVPDGGGRWQEQSQVELEIRLLEALEIYPPAKLREMLNMFTLILIAGIHRHFVLYGLTEHLRRSSSFCGFVNELSSCQHSQKRNKNAETRLKSVPKIVKKLNVTLSFNRQFAPDEVLKLLDRFYNLDMVKPEDEDSEILNQEEEFCLPHSYFSKDEP
ncbi:hypothetical protein H5410_025038 [Solanum commersonii]|uniref:Uncharacterized protein n=1 Tax=Solanum commersonii TaxID=4109 RepID=A0A9J5YT40_SOLCO|nr:hypothetical protein H5410_025038 [Solanum commersonii]